MFILLDIKFSKFNILFKTTNFYCNEDLITPQVRKERKDLLESFNNAFILIKMADDISKILHHSDSTTIFAYVDIDLVYEYWYLFVSDKKNFGNESCVFYANLALVVV
jgi:hypothetical protein